MRDVACNCQPPPEKLSIKSRERPFYLTTRYARKVNRFYFIAIPPLQSRDAFSERRLLRGRLLSGSAGEHHRVRALHASDAAFGRLPGDGGPTVVSVGPIRQHGALRLSKHADSGVRRWRADHVRPCLFTRFRRINAVFFGYALDNTYYTVGHAQMFVSSNILNARCAEHAATNRYVNFLLTIDARSRVNSPSAEMVRQYPFLRSWRVKAAQGAPVYLCGRIRRCC